MQGHQQKLYSQYRKWKPRPLQEYGVVVGSDLAQEWLLPWWWEHYSAFNSHPVAFVDFGMSSSMKKWCQERGELIPLFVADIFVAEKEGMDPAVVQEMESVLGKNFWASRHAWFKKPLACLQSPFLRSIWIDLDCEVRGSVSALFHLCSNELNILVDRSEPFSCNSGVILFKHGLDVIETWADQSFERNHLFRGDDDLLSAIIHEQKTPVTPLPEIYNWSRRDDPNPDAVIVHWHGPQGKDSIAHQMMKMNLKALTATPPQLS